MDFLVFALVYPLIWIISRLPMRILYFISDIFFFWVYYIFAYRKKVVFKNIKTAFPDKSDKEVSTITKQFFQHFCDLMIESVKAFSISEKELNKRFTYANTHLVEKYAKNRGIIITAAHQGNWEWMCNFPSMVNIPMYAAFTKLGNPYFDKVIRSSRGRFGGGGFKDVKIIRALYNNHKNNINGLYFLLSDQSPQLSKTLYWRTFFDIKVPVHTGLESLAKKYDLVIINIVSKKIKRGHYECEFQLITDKPKTFEDFKITDKYYELTEQNIKAQPSFYLWSHKRFKHQGKYEEWLKRKVK